VSRLQEGYGAHEIEVIETIYTGKGGKV